MFNIFNYNNLHKKLFTFLFYYFLIFLTKKNIKINLYLNDQII